MLLFADSLVAIPPKGKWRNVTASNTLATGRDSRECVGLSGPSDLLEVAFPGSAQIYMGVAYRARTTQSAFTILSLRPSGGNSNIELARDAGDVSRIFLKVKGVTVGWTHRFYHEADWHYIEVSANDLVAGSVEVRINGHREIYYEGNTQTGLGVISRINLMTGHFQDFYVVNSLGATNNTFLGDVTVYNLLPTGNVGTPQLTPLAGGTNWQNVSQLPLVDTKYNTSTGVHEDEFTMSDWIDPKITAIRAYIPEIFATRKDAGYGRVAPIIRLGGTQHVGTMRRINTNRDCVSPVYELNPFNSLPWTIANMTDMIAGVKVDHAN